LQLQGQIEASLRLTRRNGGWVLSGALRNRLPYKLEDVRILTTYGSVNLDAIGARGTQTLRGELLMPAPPFGAYGHGGWESVVALSPDQLARLLLERGRRMRLALLIARASEPVLTPELREAAERSAEVVYLVSVPLEETP
jgi:hypothetical protein